MLRSFVVVSCLMIALLPTDRVVAAAPAAAPVVTAAAPVDSSPAPPFQVEHSFVHTLVASALQRSYQVYVKLPPGYDKPQNAQRRYPVLYLNDGPYTFQVASGETRVPFNHDDFEEFVIVGISYAEGESGEVSRERDLTPWPDIRPKDHATGGARAYLDFLEHDVLPLVETSYRIDPARRTLAGQSYGALFGLWVLFTEPALFQNYILTSTSLWYNRHAVLASEAAFAKAHTDLNANVYFAVGGLEHPGPCVREAGACPDEDMVGDQARLVATLRGRHYRNLHLHAKVIEGTIHTTTFPTGLMWALQELFLTHRRAAP